jgi:hypothetical protein
MSTFLLNKHQVQIQAQLPNELTRLSEEVLWEFYEILTQYLVIISPTDTKNSTLILQSIRVLKLLAQIIHVL